MLNKSGFTLVELMAAMVIMLIGLLGLLQSVNIALEYNLKNQMRNEVTRIGDEAMNGMRTQPFDATFTPVTTIPTKLRNINRLYRVRRTVIAIPNPTPQVVSRQYQVDVTWKYKNVSTTHSVVSVRSRVE